MEIITLASSSAGNAYIIRNSKSVILLEAGLKKPLLVTRMLKHGILLSNLNGCFVTHQHGDHSITAPIVSTYTTVYASKETLRAARINGNRQIINAWEEVRIDSIRGTEFSVWAFPVEHDCPGSYGFIVYDYESNERLLFINDSKYIEYNFKGYQFDHIMIECNHNEEILLEKVDERSSRTANAHMSLRTTLLTLQGLNLSNTKAIYLMHLSDGNSNEDLMLESVAKQTGKPVAACQKDGGVRWYGSGIR